MRKCGADVDADDGVQCFLKNATGEYRLHDREFSVALISFSYPLFVNRQTIEGILVSTMRAPDRVDRVAFALLNAVIAIGCRTSIRKQQASTETPSSESAIAPRRYFSLALSCQDDLQNGQSSLLKLQTLVAMILFARYDHDVPLTRSLLAQAVHMIPELRLATPACTSSTQDTSLQEETERVFWILYSIEKPYALRFGSHSMIDDDLLTYHAPSQIKSSSTSLSADNYSGWEIVNYRYARLCSVIVKTLYSRATLKIGPSGTAASISRLTSMLEAWRMSIPMAYRPKSSAEFRERPEQSSDFGRAMTIFFNYAEASFAIHRWAIATTTYDPDSSSTYISSRDECVAVAKRVLSATHSFSVNDAEMEW
ncbi:hypothetical protein BKA66DRAFT_577245 [Pyrenochaeta sp. MPI-SDFR-AT-0127]|nr:hypothetical protein BKA66DRAFT_577245 [Pyrenochaeta sp. MPI-SDFR-AT-0127]